MAHTIDETMHNDGSPLGNGFINSDLYRELGICPDTECKVFGDFFKCYLPCFIQCKTYIKRNMVRVSES